MSETRRTRLSTPSGVAGADIVLSIKTMDGNGALRSAEATVISIASLVDANNGPERQQVAASRQHRRIESRHGPAVEEERVAALQLSRNRRANAPKETYRQVDIYLPAAFSRARSPQTCRSCSRPSSSLLSI